MARRFVSIWFRHLKTDKFAIRYPALREIPFVLAAAVRGRMVIQAANITAEKQGITVGMVVADAKALFPALHVISDQPELGNKLLRGLAEWCLRYTPIAAVDEPNGLILDASGCTHLWGGERSYLEEIVGKLGTAGYDVHATMADTIGTAWAICRFGDNYSIIEPGGQAEALLLLPPAALRMEDNIVQRLHKLGLNRIESFIRMPRSSLRRRFGPSLLTRLDQALGSETETIQPVCPIQPYQERLPCLEAIRTVTGIEIALEKLLQALCRRLEREGKGLRSCTLKTYRVDNHVQQIAVSTSRASRNAAHLSKLFEIKIPTIEPGLGIEVFTLEATVVEPLSAEQHALWNLGGNNDNIAIAQLLDKLIIRTGADAIRRYLPAEHHWPERSFKPASSLFEKPTIEWRTDLPRPIHLLTKPDPIEVMVPLPDYPPIQFIYKKAIYKIKRADGPERIEQEWWLEKSEPRDYYIVEDERGNRYWVYRLGHYTNTPPKWFIHGFFS